MKDNPQLEHWLFPEDTVEIELHSGETLTGALHDLSDEQEWIKVNLTTEFLDTDQNIVSYSAIRTIRLIDYK